MELSDPAAEPIEWAVYQRSWTLAERRKRCVCVTCQHAQQAWDEGTRLLAQSQPGLLREQVDVCPADRLLSAAA